MKLLHYVRHSMILLFCKTVIPIFRRIKYIIYGWTDIVNYIKQLLPSQF